MENTPIVADIVAVRPLGEDGRPVEPRWRAVDGEPLDLDELHTIVGDQLVFTVAPIAPVDMGGRPVRTPALRPGLL